MREILFRGKRKDFDNEWVYGFYSLYNDNRGMKPAIITGAENKCFIPLEVIPETVGQYTGLNDKNSKKIFEGDIHERDGHCFVVKHGKFKSFDDSGNRYGWHFEAIKGGVTEEFYGDEEKYVNIIGNIHDNPELLRGEK